MGRGPATAEAWALGLIAIAGPLLFGCVEPWSAALLEAAVGLVAGAAVIRRGWGSPRAMPALGWAALALAALGAFQLRSVRAAATPGFGPATACAWATRHAILLWLSWAALLWTGGRVFASRTAMRRAQWLVFAGGVLVAGVGIAQAGSFSRAIYGVRAIGPGRAPFGPYYNRDHAASLMAMAMAVGIGLAASGRAGGRARERVGAVADMLAERTVLAAGIALLGLALWTAGSRGAFLSLVVGLCVVALAASWRAPERRGRRRAVLALAGLAGLAALVAASPRLVGRIGGEFDASARARFAIWRGAGEMIAARPWWGHGLGTFRYAFPPWQHASLVGTVGHAHSDWLEIAVDAGLPGAACYAAGVLLMLIPGLRRWRGPGWEGADRPVAGPAAAVIAFCLHGVPESTFQIPGSAFVFLVLLSMVAARPAPPSLAPAGSATRLAVVAAALAAWVWCTFRPAEAWRVAAAAEVAAPATAARGYAEALRRDPGHPRYAFGLAVANLKLADLHPEARRLLATEALAAASAGLAGTPDDPALLDATAGALTRLGRRAEAGRARDRAARLRPWTAP